ncbi:hypothetical protein D9M72_361850 [compost metagenome]
MNSWVPFCCEAPVTRADRCPISAPPWPAAFAIAARPAAESGSNGTADAEPVGAGSGPAGWAVAWTDDGDVIGDGDVAGALGVAVSGAAVAVPVDVVPVGAGDGRGSVAPDVPASGPAISASASTSGPAFLSKRRLG